MQHIIEDAVRWLGFGVLWLVTLGRYRGGGDGDRLPEGAVGLAVIVGFTFAVWTR